MKLESLKNGKFAESTLKKEQLFSLNGGGTATAGGRGCGVDRYGRTYWADYGYDAIRTNADGSTWISYHDRSNFDWSGETPCTR